MVRERMGDRLYDLLITQHVHAICDMMYISLNSEICPVSTEIHIFSAQPHTWPSVTIGRFSIALCAGMMMKGGKSSHRTIWAIYPAILKREKEKRKVVPRLAVDFMTHAKHARRHRRRCRLGEKGRRQTPPMDDKGKRDSAAEPVVRGYDQGRYKEREGERRNEEKS